MRIVGRCNAKSSGNVTSPRARIRTRHKTESVSVLIPNIGEHQIENFQKIVTIEVTSFVPENWEWIFENRNYPTFQGNQKKKELIIHCPDQIDKYLSQDPHFSRIAGCVNRACSTKCEGRKMLSSLFPSSAVRKPSREHHGAQLKKYWSPFFPFHHREEIDRKIDR